MAHVMKSSQSSGCEKESTYDSENQRNIKGSQQIQNRGSLAIGDLDNRKDGLSKLGWFTRKSS